MIAQGNALGWKGCGILEALKARNGNMSVDCCEIISRFQRWISLTDSTWADGPGLLHPAPVALRSRIVKTHASTRKTTFATEKNNVATEKINLTGRKKNLPMVATNLATSRAKLVGGRTNSPTVATNSAI